MRVISRCSGERTRRLDLQAFVGEYRRGTLTGSFALPDICIPALGRVYENQVPGVVENKESILYTARRCIYGRKHQ